MRRLSASRASAAVAVVAAVVAVLAVVVFPGVGIGAITTSHGLSPSNVYTQTEPDVCLSAGADTSLAMEQAGINLVSESNVLVFFTTRWGRLNTHEEGLISMALDGAETEAWNTAGNPATRVTETVQWTFAGVQPGSHDLQIFARIDPIPGFTQSLGNLSADLTNCALSVFVIPVAPPIP